jgi:hypothetical protein
MAAKPTVTDLTVTLRRTIQDRPFQTYTVEVGMTAEPDPAEPNTASMDRIHDVLAGRLDSYIDQFVNRHQEKP